MSSAKVNQFNLLKIGNKIGNKTHINYPIINNQLRKLSFFFFFRLTTGREKTFQFNSIEM